MKRKKAIQAERKKAIQAERKIDEQLDFIKIDKKND